MKLKTYRVGFYYEESGYTEVKANTEAEAREMVIERLADEGLNNLEFDVMSRDYSVTDAWKKDEDDE